ncbi:transporter [Geomonas sp. Red69]|uniref:Transporter n=1 Tax=Geomonas diazotrophica TaxID=2843197 RepID=A0ABX8JFZ3_9BACT|nr:MULTISPECIES: transporter [Geomonas]MBU5638913.1 transporter [Geomonas diazotrophica]QWV96392.1 transporter [Geomonas nitrogeniifigens]QXE85459.1 transporter [Geomonas nitrogeniifigens]
MKKMVLAVLGGILMTTATAHAEHKLLVTDVLDKKQVEAQAQFEYSHTKGDISGLGETGKVTANTTESLYSVGVGLGHGLEVSASLPYVFSERVKVQMDGFAPEQEKRDGFGDFALEAKYRLLGGEEAPYTVVAGLGLKFDTAGDSEAGTGTTDVSPFIAASANLGHHNIPYAVYRATIRNHGDQDTHTLSLGFEKELSHTVTIDAKMDANFNTATRDVTANEDFTFEVASYLQMAHNFYLLPSVAYVVATDAREKNLDIHVGSADGFRAGLSLYYLF